MLYFIKGFDKDENGNLIDICKIGFSNKIEERELSYIRHGLMYGFEHTRDGDKNLEAAFHLYFRDKYKYPKYTEWFYYNEEIEQEFINLNKEKLYKLLWKYVKEFEEKEIKNSLVSEIFKYNIDKIDKNNEYQTSILSPRIIKNHIENKIKNSIENKYEGDINEDLKMLGKTIDQSKEKELLMDNIVKTLRKRSLKYTEKMKSLCEFLKQYPEAKEEIKPKIRTLKEKQMIDLWDYYGYKGCTDRKYKEEYLMEDYRVYLRKLKLIENLKKEFEENKEYTYEEIKEIFRKHYKFSKPNKEIIQRYLRLTKISKDRYTVKPQILNIE